MPNVIVTIREVKNGCTGLDLSIPNYVEKSGRFQNTLLCNVVAVSNLACFKTPQHKSSDVVQFTIPRQLEDFEQYRRDLLTTFPGVILPELPKSLFSFVGASMKQQVAILEKFLSHISTTPNLAISVETIQFLGFSSLSARKLTQATKKDDIFEEIRSEQIPDVFQNEDDTEDEDDDLFSSSTLSSDIRQQSSPIKGARLFNELDYGGVVAKDDELVLVSGASYDQYDNQLPPSEPDPDELDLLNFEDNMDDLRLQMERQRLQNQTDVQRSHKIVDEDTKPQLKPKPKPKSTQSHKPDIATKPNIAAKPTNNILFQDTQKEESNISTTEVMGLLDANEEFDANDILKYIQDNAKQDEDDLDLFS